MRKILILLACIALGACSPKNDAAPQKGKPGENTAAVTSPESRTDVQEQARKEEASNGQETKEAKAKANRDFVSFVEKYTGFNAMETELHNKCTKFPPRTTQVTEKYLCELVDYKPCPISTGTCGISSDVLDGQVQSMSFSLPYDQRDFAEMIPKITRDYGSGAFEEKNIRELRMEQNFLRWTTDNGYKISLSETKGINVYNKSYHDVSIHFTDANIPSDWEAEDAIAEKSSAPVDERKQTYAQYRLESIARAHAKYSGKILSNDAEAMRIVDDFNIDCRMEDKRVLPLKHLLYIALGQGHKEIEAVFILDRRGKTVRIYRESYKDGKVVSPKKMYYEVNEWGELSSPVVAKYAVLTACDINSDIGPMWLMPGEPGY